MGAAEMVRLERGLALAQTKRIAQKRRGLWVVPSATHAGSYVVEENERGEASCSCPDFEKRHAACKHTFAVEYARRSETMPDGTVKTTETLKMTYSQEWSKYNAAQTREKEHVARLLRQLCDTIEEPPQAMGRPRLPLADTLFACVMKVYGGLSGRRSDTDMREFAAKGLIAKAPSYNSLFRTLEDASLTPVLTALIRESAKPLAAIESDFAIDSTGFSTSTYARWYSEKWGREKSHRRFLKAHAMVGTLTHIVTGIEVTEQSEGDAPQFYGLMKQTDENFDMRQVSADGAYLSHANVAIAEKFGVQPFIPFRSNIKKTTGLDGWMRLFGLFTFNKPEFYRHYNKRSNVEATFSMIKRKFGPAVRAKLPVAQTNEVLCKVLAHNLSVIVMAAHTLGVDPTFGAGSAPASEGGV